MDLEHYELGEHCSMPGCNQKDFLPFKCDVCSRKLCLQHRSYLNHECEGAESKNCTSIACPICSKTIRFTKTENIDLIWEQHYINGCLQKPEKAAPRKSCPICNTKLGLANLFHCKLCNREVCLSHRSPEDHNCGSLHRKRQFQNNITNSKEKEKIDNLTNKKYNNNNNNNKNNNNKKANTATPLREATYSCPICGLQGFSSDLLNQHIDSKHVESQSTSNKISSNNLSEECPVCHKKFNDPISLVNHFETAHNTSNNERITGSESSCCLS
jgi:predicted nucleic acid binding AN1-type Zn finger protein